MRQFPLVLLLSLLVGVSPLRAQLAPDQPGCVDSKYVPKLLQCRIDACEKKDSDQREIPVEESDKGDPVTVSIDGNSRSVRYECREGTTPASIVAQAEALLKTAGFEIPYKFADTEATLTARKDDLWVTVDAASRFYTLTETVSAAPDFDAVDDADSIAEAILRYGHVPLFGIEFFTGRADLKPGSEEVLNEVVAVMNDHPWWRLRVEGHTDNTGTKAANLTLSFRRANAVVMWLMKKGISRTRLDPLGAGDARPIADNRTEEGRGRNGRMELVKLPGLPPQ